MRNKILSLLVLLLTAASGAWAEDTYTVTITANNNSKTIENVTLPYTFMCSYSSANDELDLILKELYGWTGDNTETYCDNSIGPETEEGKTEYVAAGKDNNNNHYIRIEKAFEGIVTVSGVYVVKDTRKSYELVISLTAPDVTVTTNAETAGDCFTEATFAMPAGDVTVDYELLRDMSVQMPVTVGDGEEGYLIRLKKDEQTNKFVPADMTAQEMKELIKVHDAIEDNDLTFGLLGANCTISIFKVDDEGQPTGEAIAFADLEPGRYVAKATAALNSAYEGETALSNIFELIEAYNVKFIAADDFSQGKIGEVTIDSEAATIDEDGVVKNVKKDSEVKFKAKRGYVFEKAETKKDGELKTLDIDGVTIYYLEGETWQQAKANHSENTGWKIEGSFVKNNNGTILIDSAYETVDPSQQISSSESYEF